MKTKWTTYSRCSRAAGLTLIEVVAAIAILGTLLVGIVLAKSRHTRQLSLAQRKATAVVLIDELIGQWWSAPPGSVPVGRSGRFEDEPNWLWRTVVVANAPIESLGLRVVRVEVMDESAAVRGSSTADATLVRVDLVLPDPAVALRESRLVIE